VRVNACGLRHIFDVGRLIGIADVGNFSAVGVVRITASTKQIVVQADTQCALAIFGMNWGCNQKGAVNRTSKYPARRCKPLHNFALLFVVFQPVFSSSTSNLLKFKPGIPAPTLQLSKNLTNVELLSLNKLLRLMILPKLQVS